MSHLFNEYLKVSREYFKGNITQLEFNNMQKTFFRASRMKSISHGKNNQ